MRQIENQIFRPLAKGGKLKILKNRLILLHHETDLRIFRYLCVRKSLLGREPIVFRTILKYDNNNTRMTKATKLTPSRRGH